MVNTLGKIDAWTEHDAILLEDLAQSTQLPFQDNFPGHVAIQSMVLAELEIAYLRRI
ncbi:hypothetical protein METHB2_240035 [Candidatus Methylobacter favarea]|uniref:Uncharacterized protein n=1 Tax=Candidatus Methylobacter favarea TaxID=2707345 RepID=A0A8S0XS77_9GAMM|nr:hypothetical protein METHB2_240035 [Candidatus Methylobacter favarea]